MSEPADEEPVCDPQKGRQQQFRHRSTPMHRVLVDKRRAQLVARPEPLGVGPTPPGPPAPDAPADGGRRRQHRGPCQAGAPAEVQRAVEEADLGVEPADRPEEVATDQQRRFRGGEDLAVGVVLALVEFAGFEAWDRSPVPVDPGAHVLEVAGIRPVEDLRPDHAGVGLQCALHHAPHRRPVQDQIVMQEEVVGGAIQAFQGDVGGLAESGITRSRGHLGPRQNGRDAFHQALAAAGVHHQHVEAAVVLGADRRQDLLEPVAGVVGDEHQAHESRRRRGSRTLRRRVSVALPAGGLVGIHGARTLLPGMSTIGAAGTAV